MIKTFREYQSEFENLDFGKLGEINESHQYADSISSVMDKLTFYVKRNIALEGSELNESAKRAYGKDVKFNRDERIAVGCIFNEMLKQYEENMKNEIALCEAIINQGSLLEEGVEYDYDSIVEKFSINEGVGDWIKMKLSAAAEKISDTTKEVMSDAKDLVSKGVDVVKAKKDDLVAWAKDAKKDFEEKYEGLKKLIDNIVKKGVDSVSAFINNILEVFTSIGDNLVDAVKKLGGLKMDKDETPAKLSGIEDVEGIYANAKSTEEKSFINNIILRVDAIMNKDKENATKLMNESYLEESIVDNKFIAWLAGYKSDGTKMSWWKCILIGLCASLIVWILPKVLVGFGLGAALASFIAAFVGVIWNGIGMLKLIYRRNKTRKPGEKFFNASTLIFFLLSVFSTVFSVATFVSTITPLMREICNHFGWVDGENLDGFAKWFFELTKKFSPKDAFQEGGIEEWLEEVKNHGGDYRGNDLLKVKDDIMDAVSKMPGITDEQKTAIEQFLDVAKDAKGTSEVYKAWETLKDNVNLPLTTVFDTSKWGGAGPIKQALDELVKSGEVSSSAILGTAGSTATQAASHGQYGFANFIMGASKEETAKIFARAAEIAGKDANTLHMHTYGSGVISDVITHTETIKGTFDVLAPEASFLPIVIPFFDDKKWGQYKMRFASATRGAAAYVVDNVEMVKGDDIKETSPALDILKQLHTKAWEEYKRLHPDTVNEGLFKKDKKEDKKIEEPQYIVFYVNDNDTNNSEDKPDEEKNEKNEGSIGVVIDTLTMMVADVCNFNKSANIRRREKPYFMKGLLSRLSFRPVEDNDNETKDFIRTTLGQTMNTLVLQSVLYGMGSKYIDSKIDGKKAEYTLRETLLTANENEKGAKINGDKAVFELGNFSPNELLQCLTDDSKSNKVSYDFLDGQYASKVTIKTDGNGNISTKVMRDESSIENVKYYRVKKETYKETMADYEKKLEKWKKNKEGKRPVKPSFIKGDDGEFYKKASKKFLSDPANKRKNTYDFVDIRIKPLLKKGELYKKLVANNKIKNVLYKEDEENNVKLNKEVLTVLKPFLYRPEKTFAKDDEHQLSALLKEQGVEGEKLGWFKNLFKDEEQLHDTFKEMVEIIWDYLSDNRRKVYKGRDFKKNHGKTNEGFETTLFDDLIEEFLYECDEETEYQYDEMILNEKSAIMSYEDFLIERY